MKAQGSNSVSDMNQANHDELKFQHFDDEYHKLKDFYSIRPFTTEKERDDYIMGKMDRDEEDALVTKYFDSVSEAIKINRKRRLWRKEKLQQLDIEIDEKLRKNIKVLIIIGTKLEYKSNHQNLKSRRNKFISGYNDMNTALLIRHLFYYACNISYDDILITSSNGEDFQYLGIPEVNISPTSSPSNKSTSEKRDSDDHHIDIPTDLYINDVSTIINCFAYVQVGKQQIQFLPDISPCEDIKPFNRYFLKSLKTDENSELLVFILDNGSAGFFARKDYQYFVERLMEMPSNHITIFNQSCYSGSLIELIEISELIDKVFKLSPEVDQTIFENLFNVTNDKSKSIDEKVQKIYNDYNIPNTGATTYNIIQIIELLTHYKKSFKITPKLFIELKNKSTIICSCSSTEQSQTLPFRQIIGPEQRIKIANTQGGIFSSCYLDCLFHPSQDNDFSITKFTQNLQVELKEMEKEFMEILVQQNTIDESPSENIKEISDQYKLRQETMNNYFKTNFSSPKISISSRGKILNIRSITLPQELWNIDVTEVDPLEYKTKVYDFVSLQDHSDVDETDKDEENIVEIDQDENHYVYGPVKGIFNDFKFILDFVHCFECIRKSCGIQQEFKASRSADRITEQTEEKFRFFNVYVNDVLDFNTEIPFFFLVPLIKSNFQERFSEVDNFFMICRQALQETVKYWQKVEFYHIMI